jgi:hypothetical protein
LPAGNHISGYIAILTRYVVGQSCIPIAGQPYDFDIAFEGGDLPFAEQYQV